MYYLKTNNETELWETLIDAGLAEVVEIVDLDKTTTFNAPKHGVSLDIIGVIQKPTGEVREEQEGMMVPVFADIEGFHANLKTSIELTEEQQNALSAISIDAPSTPHRVWFQ